MKIHHSLAGNIVQHKNPRRGREESRAMGPLHMEGPPCLPFPRFFDGGGLCRGKEPGMVHWRARAAAALGSGTAAPAFPYRFSSAAILESQGGPGQVCGRGAGAAGCLEASSPRMGERPVVPSSIPGPDPTFSSLLFSFNIFSGPGFPIPGTRSRIGSTSCCGDLRCTTTSSAARTPTPRQVWGLARGPSGVGIDNATPSRAVCREVDGSSTKPF